MDRWPDVMGLMEPGHGVLAGWLEEAGTGLSETSPLSVFACSSPQPSREGRRFPVLPYEDTGSGGERAFPKPTAWKA